MTTNLTRHSAEVKVSREVARRPVNAFLAVLQISPYMLFHSGTLPVRLVPSAVMNGVIGADGFATVDRSIVGKQL
jgi:hypothetical protein